MYIGVEWSIFKSFVTARGLSIQYLQTADTYYLFALDGNFGVQSQLSITDPASVDQADFEANFKANGNKKIEQQDSDSAPMARIKQAPTGWNYQNRGFEFCTATFTLYNKDVSGNNLTDLTVKLYDASNNEITTPGLLDINLASCVKTVIDFEPTYDYYIISGQIRPLPIPTSDVRLSVIGVPDIPAIYGGSRPFIQNTNLKYLAGGSGLQADGRAAKFLAYSATLHTNKLRVVITHPAGEQNNMQLNIELYKA